MCSSRDSGKDRRGAWPFNEVLGAWKDRSEEAVDADDTEENTLPVPVEESVAVEALELVLERPIDCCLSMFVFVLDFFQRHFVEGCLDSVFSCTSDSSSTIERGRLVGGLGSSCIGGSALLADG